MCDLLISKILPPLYFSEDIEWLVNLPFTLSLPTLDAIVVHAGLVPGVSFDQQNASDMYSMRNLFMEQDASPNVSTKKLNELLITSWKATSKANLGEPWASIWNGPHHIYFGHDAKRGLQLYPFATGLDSGCCYGEYRLC